MILELTLYVKLKINSSGKVILFLNNYKSFLISLYQEHKPVLVYRFDYLSIENNQDFGKYCGVRSGESVIVTGRYVNISFHSDGSDIRRGYNVSFSAVLPVGEYSELWCNMALFYGQNIERAYTNFVLKSSLLCVIIRI